MLAWGTDAGPVAQFGFGTLAIGSIIARLRLFLPIAAFSGHPFLEGYRLISWLAWVPNLLVAELYLNWSRRRKPAIACA